MPGLVDGWPLRVPKCSPNFKHLEHESYEIVQQRDPIFSLNGAQGGP